MKTYICHCGSNHDAVESALRLARQSIKTTFKGEGDCPAYIHAVALAYAQIVQVLFNEWAMAMDAEVGNEYSTNKEKQHEALEYSTLIRNQRIYAAFCDNPEATKDIAKFICDEVGIPSVDRKQLEEGVSATLVVLNCPELIEHQLQQLQPDSKPH